MKNYFDMLGKIKNRDEFLEFMEQYSASLNNADIQDYLESVTAWVRDCDGYYANTGRKMPENINWDFIATLFYVGKIYE